MFGVRESMLFSDVRFVYTLVGRGDVLDLVSVVSSDGKNRGKGILYLS